MDFRRFSPVAVPVVCELITTCLTRLEQKVANTH